jgi:hypothetical protein
MLTGLNWVLIHGCHNVSCKCVPNVYYLTKSWDGKQCLSVPVVVKSFHGSQIQFVSLLL